MTRLNFRLPPAICFLLTFLLGLGLVVLFTWFYTYILPILPDYDRWWLLYRVVFYGFILLLVLWLIKVVPDSTNCSRSIIWPFTSFQRLLPKKEAWDWIQLIGGTTLLGIIASVISFFVTQSNAETAQRLQDQKERQKLVADYMNDMTQLLKGARYADMKDELKVAISSRTLNTLEALKKDSSLQGHALRFASRAFPDFVCPLKSDENYCRMPANISLHGINLKGFRIDETNTIKQDLLEGADLREADLEGSNLTRASLTNTNMKRAILRDVIFGSGTPFGEASFEGADLAGSQFLGGSDLSEVPDLEKAIFNKLNPTFFSTNTRFNQGFLSRICEFRQMNYIQFTDQKSTREATQNLKAQVSCPHLVLPGQ